MFDVKELVYNYEHDDIWQIPEGRYQVKFADAVVEMTNRQIIMSWYYWELYRTFPGIDIISAGAVTGYVTTSTHRELGSILVWHVYNSHQLLQGVDLWRITKAFYEITNALYNISCIKLTEYVTSTSLHDLIEILEVPEIIQAKQNYLTVCEESNYTDALVAAELKKTHNVVSNVLYKDHDYLKHNGVKHLCITGLVNRGQMLQMIGPRGYVQDIDGKPFPYPINVGYLEGLTTLYDNATESRSASRASLMNVVPLQQSEWFNRKVQLAACIIMDVDRTPGGCTGYETVKHSVGPDDYALLKGKYHMVDGRPELIWDSIDHLVGKVIEMRSLTGCGCTNVQNVCHICLGWSHHILPPRTNLGYFLATPLCAKISQIIMSTKHHESSTVSKPLELNAISSRWVRVNSKHPDQLFLTDYAINGNLLLRISSEYVKQLSQILHVDVSELPPTRISSIPEFFITHTDRTGELLGPLDELKLSVDGVGVHLSRQALTYLKEHGWGSDKNSIEFNLRNWNPNTPLFIIPRKGDNIMTFFNTIKTFIEPEKKSDLRITACRTRGGALSDLLTILQSRLGGSFNIIQAEVFVRALMMVDFNSGQFELPHPSQDFQFVGLKKVILNRSLTSMLAYQEQFGSLLDTQWQTNEQKTEHLLDPLLYS